MRQVFLGEVGQVAGRDINNFAPTPPNKHEAKLKDVMPKRCHDDLDWLLEHTDLSAKSLYRACSRQALVCVDGNLMRAHVGLDYSAAGLYLTFIVGFKLLLVAIALGPNEINLAAAWIAGSALALLGMFVLSIHVWPQKDAAYAVRALQRRHEKKTFREIQFTRQT